MAEPTTATTTRYVRGGCPLDCPDTCSWIATVQDGRATELRGAPDHPFTRGFLCAKVSRYLRHTYHEERLLHPMRRVGPKGAGRFARVSWDEALAEVAERLHAITSSPDGPQAIYPYWSGGTLGLLQGYSMGQRLFHRLGASLNNPTICSAAAEAAATYTLGATRPNLDPEALPNARLILLWGTNTLTSNPHLWPFIEEARRAGARVVAIDPLRTRTAARCDEHLAVRPGTDAALALGLLHVIFAERLEDADYLAAYTVGADQLRARAAEFSPQRVAEIVGVDVDSIVRLARAYAAAQPAAIRVNYGMQRTAGAGQAVRAILSLPAVCGHWRFPGGGTLLSTSGMFPVPYGVLARPDLIPRGPGGTFPRALNMSRLGESLDPVATNNPPVRALVVFNANPAATAPNQERVRQGLLRDDLFTVVVEHFQTDTADYADILLPATTQLEHADLLKSYGHLYWTWNEPAITPLGEALPNTEIFRRLAAAMGLDDPCFHESDEALARQALAAATARDTAAMEGITLEALRAAGSLRLRYPPHYAPLAAGGFTTPSGRCELYSASMAQAGLDPLPAYIPPNESPASNPALAARFPLNLLSTPAHHFLNSTFANVLDTYAGEPHLAIHPEDARPRGIVEGAMVRVFNDRGAFEVRATLSTDVRPGVVHAPSVWWPRRMPGGRGVNATTPEVDADLGGAPTFYDNLVQVEPIA